MPRPFRKLRRLVVFLLLVAVAGTGLLYFTPQGQAVKDIWGNGIIQAQLTGKEMEEYHASTEGNLKAIYNAMKLYQDSEGQFPLADGWVDAIQNRILVNNMTGEEAHKKLVSPAAKPEEYGYAMNDKASGKYIGDLDPKMPLIFDSMNLAKNAHGLPENLAPKPPRGGQNLAISVDGTILKL
ncbi:hypothetical protein BH11ARM1_BH11ARM1_02120 [soil metagenome]